MSPVPPLVPQICRALRRESHNRNPRETLVGNSSCVSGRNSAYWDWIKAEALRTHSDGCTGVSEWHHECCLEHDLACLFGKNPLSAFEVGWDLAAEMSRSQADKMFAGCNFDHSSGGGGYLRSLIRYWGVRAGAMIGIGVRK